MGFLHTFFPHLLAEPKGWWGPESLHGKKTLTNQEPASDLCGNLARLVIQIQLKLPPYPLVIFYLSNLFF